MVANIVYCINIGIEFKLFAMSLARSNISNDSSRSNILTLSQDSNSSAMKSHAVNVYYSKFISRLNQFFRIDTQDLDILYNKIVECVNESDRFTKSDDADINELIQLASKLKYNHGLLKNMVEVLDQRFIKNKTISKILQQQGQPINKQLIPFPKPKQAQDSKDSVHSTQIQIKKQKELNNVESSSSINSNSSDYSHFFANTLKKAREEVQKKKILQKSEEQQKQTNAQQIQNNIPNISHSKISENNIKLANSDKASRKELLQSKVQKMMQEMSKIKKQLQDYQNEQNNQQQRNQTDPEVSLSVQHSQLNNSKFSQKKLPLNFSSKGTEEDHTIFKQVSEDDYYLHDDRFQTINNNEEGNVPKLSLKQLYSKLGMDPNADPSNYSTNYNKQYEMTMIKQTSRESGSLVDIPHKQTESEIQPEKHIIHYEHESEPKKIEQQKQSKKTLHDHDFQAESERSYNVSNSSIIDKLTKTSHDLRKQNSQKRMERFSNTSITEQQNYNIQAGDAAPNFTKKKDTFQSIQTMAVTNSISGQASNQNFVYAEQPEDKKSRFYLEIVERNDKSRQKINHYLERLDQRNRTLKKYVEDMQKSLSKEKQKNEEIFIAGSEGKKSVFSNNESIRSLSNAVYTQNEIIVPKYVPTESDKTIKPNAVSEVIIQNPRNTKKLEQAIFSQSEVNQKKINKYNLQYFEKLPTYSQKDMELGQFQHDKQIKQNIKGKGMKPLVPMLVNLVQNQQKTINVKKNLIEIQQQKQKKKLTLKNNHYFASNHKANENENNFEIGQQNSTMSQDKQKNSQAQGQSQKSFNSLSDRMDAHQNMLNNNTKAGNQIIIPRVTTKQLFEDTRNVQSKIELSQDRGYKMKVPGEQIERIKDRVNEMFKKIKSIRDDSSNPLSNLQIPSVHSLEDLKQDTSIQRIETHEHKQLFLQSKQSEQQKPQNIIQQSKLQQNKELNQFQKIAYSTGTFKKQQRNYIAAQQIPNATVNQKNNKDFQLIQNFQNVQIADSLIMQPTNQPRMNFKFQSTKNSIQIQNKNKSNSPIFDSRNLNFGLNFSRQSNLNFSFRGQQTTQQSMRNSFNNNYETGLYQQQRVSRAESNSSTGSRNSQRIITIQPRKQHNLLTRTIPSRTQNYALDSSIHSNNSRQSKNQRQFSNEWRGKGNVIKSFPVIVPIGNPNSSTFKNSPPLPPKLLSPKMTDSHSKPQLIKTQSQTNIHINNGISNFPKPSLINSQTNIQTIRNQKQQIKYQQPIKSPKTLNPNLISNFVIPQQRRSLLKNYSQPDFNQSVVTRYSEVPQNQRRQHSFIPPNIPLIAAPVIPKPRSSIIEVTSSKKFQNNKLSQSSHNLERSSTHSHKSKKGINVISKSPPKISS